MYISFKVYNDDNKLKKVLTALGKMGYGWNSGRSIFPINEKDSNIYAISFKPGMKYSILYTNTFRDFEMFRRKHYDIEVLY